ncbi:MAG: NnrU family protein [Proteobacteria bacterium]|nr:NnrU family protein [Pseudomonadota bacterium]
MTGSLDALIAATAVFVFGHFLLSSRPLRAPLVRTLGQGGFLSLYSLAVAAAFLWMLTAYREAPAFEVWAPVPVLNWVPILVMPVAIFLVLAGITTANPTMVGGEQRIAAGGPARRAPGIISVTRHPFLWGTTLWALSHLAANGEAAEMVVMGGILALSLGGMAHIDERREAALGSAWGPVKLTTSVVPFVAILSGRAELDWKGIGWWRPAGALALYAAIMQAHAWIAGVPVTVG